ncbi:ABC transporter permease [Alkalispirochaeta sphaeroplastigenens]|uniref:ABC transporter permease n=1 Tax=Alkalispirochaeta sphaeroplastigenens TaxID=1187066 RepID=A0A2S4JVK5_9SPIO|nr:MULTISPECIES: sugar ABC transporter permease [Alkalispirochaeta]POR03551.1 ABC transporter permease [Alkalispirochaeta sphaeroplastigenens]
MKSSCRGSSLEPLLFTLPCIVMLGVFVYLPLIQNFYFSLYSFSAFSPNKLFIGLENYRLLVDDPVVRTALINNVRYAVISVLIQVCFGLVLAAILEDKSFKRVGPFFRTVFFMPVLMSISVVCLLFGFIYHPIDGLLNQFLEIVGLPFLQRPWLGSARTAIWATIAVSQWHSTGYIMMLFLVSIQKIPEELYEACELDGAHKITRFRVVTLPHVKEIFFVASVITVTGSFMVFSEPYILTRGGGPGTSSITMAVYLYQSGFFRDMMGYASTLAIVIFVISVVLAVFQAMVFRTGKE